MHSITFLARSLLVAQCFAPVTAMLRFEVDLDMPPRQRWTHITNHWKDYIIAMTPYIGADIKKAVGDNVDEWHKVAEGAFDEEASEELLGISETLQAAGQPKADPTFAKIGALLYELGSPTVSKGCSGVLWAAEDGTVTHGRNMDYVLHFNYTDKHTGVTSLLNWNDVTYEVVFNRGGTPLFMSTMWPGSIFIATGMRFNGWSFEQNTRPGNDAALNLAAGQQGGKPFGLVARRVMETTPDFETAVEKMYGARLMAPQYFIMSGSGPYQGAVLTMDRLGKHEIDTPKIIHISKSPRSAWHLVQTNDDLGATALDARRPGADKKLAQMEQSDVSVDHMLQFMHSAPLLDPLTVYTTVMVPATNYYHTILPNEQVPDFDSVLEKNKKVLPSIGGASLSEDSRVISPHLHVLHPQRNRRLRAGNIKDEVSLVQVSTQLQQPEVDDEL